MDAREKLLKRIGDINDFSKPRPLVDFELFFEGNNDFGSIGYNLDGSVGPKDFYKLLKEINKREDVLKILIEVKDLEDPEGWPSTDTIWFITQVREKDVMKWFPNRLKPDEIIIGFPEGETEEYIIPSGYQAIAAWYD